MFFIISKILGFLTMPLGWIILWGGGLVWKYKLPKVWLFLGVLLVGVTSNRFIVSNLINWWEINPVEISKLPKKKVAVVLTGGLFSEDSKPYENFHIGTHADRMIQALKLYQAGKVEHILITGGSLDNLYSDSPSEAELAKGFYLDQGVPAEAIWVENQARNTHENARYSIALLNEKNIRDRDVFVVTSALHMRRSLACFEKVGWKSAYHATNPLASEPPQWRWIYLFPDHFSFYQFNQLMHELIGYVIYDVVGYL